MERGVLGEVSAVIFGWSKVGVLLSDWGVGVLAEGEDMVWVVLVQAEVTVTKSNFKLQS